MGISRVIIPNALTMRTKISRHNALIGKFMGSKPSFGAILSWTRFKWKLKGSVELIALPCDCIMFNFNQEEDLMWVLANGFWWFGRMGLVLKKWTKDFRPQQETFSVILIWCALPNLLDVF